jgi:hypothetical protein
MRMRKTHTTALSEIAVATHLSPCADTLDVEKAKEYDIALKCCVNS